MVPVISSMEEALETPNEYQGTLFPLKKYVNSRHKCISNGKRRRRAEVIYQRF